VILISFFFSFALLEAIELSNYKSALSQCNKLLKKQPEALILKVSKLAFNSF
jgi:hypothetical protein